MGLVEAAGKTAIDLVKSEGIQNKAASALGMLFPYAGIRKHALDMYIHEIEESDLPIDTKMIAILNAKDTIKKLKNKKDIADIAIENAEEGTCFDAKSGVNQEWLERFMDSAGFVSEEEVQLMWGKILGNEFENPGSTPLNMIRILSEMTPQYAQAFQTICSMRRYLLAIDETGEPVAFRDNIVVPYTANEEEMRSLGLSYNVLTELETLGLIKFSTMPGFVTIDMPKKCTICTYVDGVTKELEEGNHESVAIGNVILTDAGRCLSKITEAVEIKDYELLEKRYMNRSSTIYKEKATFEITKDEEGTLHFKRRGK